MALVNAEGRVVVSNHPSPVSGSVTHAVDVPTLWAGGPVGGAALHRLADLSLGVLVLS